MNRFKYFTVPICIYSNFEKLLLEHKPASDVIHIDGDNTRLFRCHFSNVKAFIDFYADFSRLAGICLNCE